MLQKIVLNKDYGVVELSDTALKKLGIESISEIERTDARLVGLFENGDEEKLSGDTSRLQLVDVDMESDMDYLIIEHDGNGGCRQRFKVDSIMRNKRWNGLDLLFF